MTIATHKIGTDGSHQGSWENSRKANYSTPLPILTRGVVVDVFNDISLLTDEAIEDLSDRVQNSDALRLIRRNCILVEEITGELSRTTKPIICLPLLDPYISLPFKPGETVLMIKEDQYGAPNEMPFVLCRLPSYQHVDDINYTHDDRKFRETKTSRDAEDTRQSLGTETTQEKIDFQNGNPDDDSYTIGSTKDEYDKIWNSAQATKQCVLEPVPRFTKRPGDQTLQGSNNTLINLTTDRIGPVANDDELQQQRGAIDIVVGRGFTPDYQPNENTAPNVIENTRAASEVDKLPYINNKVDVVAEGDPDFVNDPSRIYVAMKTDIDKSFNIDIQDIGEEPVASRAEVEKPAIALKTNQLRLVGREDVKIQADNGDGQGAAIVLKADGNIILIPGPNGHIMLGGESADITPLCSIEATRVGQTISAQPIIDTALGKHGQGGPTGKFPSKVIMK